jgi:hypothetical protein
MLTGDIIFASSFTYDLTGKGSWLTMTAAQTSPGECPETGPSITAGRVRALSPPRAEA